MEWIKGGAPLFVLILTVGIAAAQSFFLLYMIVLPLIRGQRNWQEEKRSGALAVIEGIETHHSKHVAAA
jgi:hypothetical protein